MRQRQVLDLVAKGHTNGQIADELGITLDGAKWHLREIFTRLGVDSREEAAEYWRTRNAPRARLRRFAGGLFGLSAAKVAGTGAAIAVMAVVAGAVYLALNDNDGPPLAPETPTPTEAGAEPTPSLTPTPMPSPSPGDIPSEIDGVPVRELTLGEPRPLPGGLLLTYRVTCYACSPGQVGLRRASMHPDGTLVREDLGPRISAVSPGRIAAIVPSEAQGTWFAAVCLHGACGNVLWPGDDGETALLRSTDGGVTWEVIDTVEGGLYLVGVLGEEVVAQRHGPDGPIGDVQLLPSGETITPPPGLNREFPPLVLPEVWPDVGLVWWNPGTASSDDPGWFTDGQFVDGEGEPIAARPPQAASGALQSFAGSLVATWSRDGDTARYLTAYSADREPAMHYAWPALHPEGGGVLWVAGAISPTLLVGNVALPTDTSQARGPDLIEPAIIDLEAGTVHVISGISDGLEGNAHPFVSGVAVGPWARVDGAGTCLNVREEPSTDAGIIDCHVDGVLLRDLGDMVTAEGIEWLAVETPNGTPGWAALEFLLR